MQLKQKIEQDLKEALKKKERLKLEVLRMLNSSLHNKEIEKKSKLRKEGKSKGEIEKQGKLNNEEVIEIVFSEAKKRKESISEFEKGGREDLVEKEKKELKILEKYLPEQLSEDEIRKIVQKIIEETGAKGMKDMGQVMSKIMVKVKGKAEGSLVNKTVKDLLS